MKITKNQKEIARQLGIRAVKSDSFNVLAAKIRDQVAIAIGDWKAANPTERQLEYAKSLGINVGKYSRRVISAKIEDELTKRNVKALKKLKLKLGDKVTLTEEVGIRCHIVSTIKDNGKIYFKGIGCSQAWATQIKCKNKSATQL